MALNPIMNVYTLTLNPKDKNSNPTYRDLFKSKFHSDCNLTDEQLFNSFFQSFLNKIGKSNFRNDTKHKKVIGVSEYNPDNEESSLHLHSTSAFIEGIIDGGQYGISRAYADVNNKEHKQDLSVNQAVLDKFYICVCTPLNSANGFLFLQSYTESSIQESVKLFIKEVLSSDTFYDIIIQPYVPNHIIEQYKQKASIRMFSFKSKIGISDSLRVNQTIQNNSFNIEIRISPIGDNLDPTSSETRNVISRLKDLIFDGVHIGDYQEKKVYLKDDNDKKVHYNIEDEIKKIKPTIYLKNEGISVDEITGQPDFNQIKNFTIRLLTTVKDEYDSDEDIQEL